MNLLEKELKENMSKIDFVALDVETANTDVGSICQIGLAAFKDGALIQEWTSLINPEEAFSAFNIKVHGLTAAHVTDAPTLPEVADNQVCRIRIVHLRSGHER